MKNNDPFRIDVTDRLPQALSPSAADTYAQCPKQFYYKYILGIRSGGTIHTFRGTLVHLALERVFDLEPAERTIQAAHRYLEPAMRMTLDPFPSRDEVDDEVEIALRDLEGRWDDSLDVAKKRDKKKHDRAVKEAAELEQILAEHGADEPDLDTALQGYGIESPAMRARLVELADCDDPTAFTGYDLLLAEMRWLVANWFRMEDPGKFNPAAQEIYVRAKVAGVTLHGFIDRLDRVELDDGREVYVVSDYKSGKVPQDRYVMPKFFQLRVYALLLREIHGYTPRMLRLIYVKGGDKDAVKKLVIDDDTLDRTAQQLKSMWAQITRDAKSNRWATKTSALCPWCDFQPVCPAFNDNAEGMLAEEQELYGLDDAA